MLKDPFAISVFADDNDEYRRHYVTIQVVNRLAGGTPSNPKTIEGWIRANAGISDDKEVAEMMLKTLQQLGHDVQTTDLNALRNASEEIAAQIHTNVFKHDENGLFIEGRQVMAMLRESVSVLYTGIPWGQRPAKEGKDSGRKGKAATSFFRERVHVPHERIYLGCQEPDGIQLVLVHPKDSTRESSMHYVEYVEQPVFSFVVEELADKQVPTNCVPPEAWTRIWRHAERNGLGAMRSQQYGKFAVVDYRVEG